MIAAPGKTESHDATSMYDRAVFEHAAPRRLGRLGPEAEEAERRLGEDRDRQVDRHEHDQRRHDVREHVPKHDPEPSHPRPGPTR